MRRKSIVILVLVLALSLFATACTSKVEDKAPEEPAITDGDKVEEEVVESDWPKSFMPTVPELKGDIVLSEERSEDQRYIGYESLDYDAAVAYVEDLKAAGFTVNPDEKIEESLVKYKSFNNDLQLVKFFWTANGRAGVDLIIKDGVK
jgi:hypothetical protein